MSYTEISSREFTSKQKLKLASTTPLLPLLRPRESNDVNKQNLIIEQPFLAAVVKLAAHITADIS